MSRAALSGMTLATLLLAGPAVLTAQSYHGRLDTRGQRVQYRGLIRDSVLASDTVTGPAGGPETADGFAVHCLPGAGWCTFFRPGEARTAAPLTTTADVTVWGLGVEGLTVTAAARVNASLAEAPWPGTQRAFELLRAHATWTGERWEASLGRQEHSSRLGWLGFDGARIERRAGAGGVAVRAFAGWSLARGAVLPVSSPALNPLGEYRPAGRQVAAGVAAGWTAPAGDLEVGWQREGDPSGHGVAAEAAFVQLRLRRGHWSFAAGSDHDFAIGGWGNADASVMLAVPARRVTARAGVRRYRPRFDLWTIWGAFSPVPYHAADAALTVGPVRRVTLQVRGERYTFADAEAVTPLVRAEQDGWRFALQATAAATDMLAVEYGYHAEFGPGAASRGITGAVRWTPAAGRSLALRVASLERPLEFRYDDARLTELGLDAAWRLGARLDAGIAVTRYWQEKRRPDAAALDWRQTRLAARLEWRFGHEPGQVPDAVRRMPEPGVVR